MTIIISIAYLVIGIALTSWQSRTFSSWLSRALSVLLWPLTLDIVIRGEIELRRIEKRGAEARRRVAEGESVDDALRWFNGDAP